MFFCLYIVVTFFSLFVFKFFRTCAFYIYRYNCSLIIPFTLALSFNIGFVFWGFALSWYSFSVLLFVPSGVPFFIMLPLIIVIEIMSYTIRTFSCLCVYLLIWWRVMPCCKFWLLSFKLFLLLSGLLFFFSCGTFFSCFCLFIF